MLIYLPVLLSLTSFKKFCCIKVSCDTSFLNDLNAQLDPSNNPNVTYPDKVMVQCKPNYIGSDVEYECNTDEKLVPVNKVQIMCSRGNNKHCCNDETFA